MLTIYLAALIFGLGMFAVQLFASSGAHGSGAFGDAELHDLQAGRAGLHLGSGDAPELGHGGALHGRAAEARARAQAAPALEAGKATAQALRLLSAQWGQAGALGRELYVLQHLDELVAHAAERVAKSHVGELSVVDEGDGQSYTQAVAMYPAAGARVMEAVGLVLGADMKKMLGGEPAPNGMPRPVPVPDGVTRPALAPSAE